MSTALSFLALLAAVSQVASEPDAAAKKANQASLERMVADLAQFEFSLAIEPPEALKLSGEPVLRWSNPIRNVDDAAVFVWLSKERPEVVATVMSYRDGQKNLRRAYEFLSLSQDKLTGVQGGRRVWQPEKLAFVWREVPGAPAAAETAAQRRRQMRDLAAKFQVAVEADKNRYELRLLAQPLYRYENAKADILDGALYAFVEGTDPELILALETPRVGKPWKFATGRLTRWGIEVRYQDKVMNEFPQMSGPRDAADAVYRISDGGPLDAAEKSPGEPDMKP
jgi:hypothetical protein